MKMLNLDAFAENTRTITLGGVVYEVEEMTVENFIATTKAIDSLEKKEGATIADQMEMTIDMILRSVPKLPREKLRKLNLEKLSVIGKFLRGEMDDEKNPEAGSEEGSAEGK